MAVKPPIDLTSIISRAVSRPTLGRTRRQPAECRVQTHAGVGRSRARREARGELCPYCAVGLQHAGLRQR